MQIKFRLARLDDCILLFNWANDVYVRNNAFNQNKILYENHKKWLNSKLSSCNTRIFIVDIDGEEVGQIRIDGEGTLGLIDFSVDKKHRGKNYGRLILKEIINKVAVEGLNITRLVGRVKYNNMPSRKAFQNAGYSSIFKDSYIEYYTDL